MSGFPPSAFAVGDEKLQRRADVLRRNLILIFYELEMP